jgi:anaerobic selenocysteine-containing dehydrogenase
MDRVVAAYRQVAERDRLELGAAVKSGRSERLAPRVRDADTVTKSVCPYCAVGCGQNVYVKDGKVIQIEGDPDSPSWPPDGFRQARGLNGLSSRRGRG